MQHGGGDFLKKRFDAVAHYGPSSRRAADNLNNFQPRRRPAHVCCTTYGKQGVVGLDYFERVA